MNSTNSTETNHSPQSLDAYTLIFCIVYAGLILFNFVSFILTFPLGTTLLKYRVNYVPRRNEDQNDEGAQWESGHPAKSYFDMLHRVLKFENWGGMYKGFTPSLIIYLMKNTLLLIVQLGRDPKIPIPPQSFLRQALTKVIIMLFSIPTTIVINRAITTHHKLPWINVKCALKRLLTEEERRRPWLLYLTPGVFLSNFTFGVYNIATKPISTTIIELDKDGQSSFLPRRSFERICVLLSYSIICNTINCAYENVFARISVQRNYAHPQGSIEKMVSEEGASEKKAHVFDCGQSYTGFLDCAKYMVKEDGYSAFFRAWWCDYLAWWGLLFVL